MRPRAGTNFALPVSSRINDTFCVGLRLENILMLRTGLLFAVLGVSLCLAEVGMCEDPQKVNICEVKNNPAAYNHKLIEVTAFISHGFEDFGIFDPDCNSLSGIWLEYGGSEASGTMYCCGVTGDRKRPQPLKIEGISLPLVADGSFREFDRLIQQTPDSIVHGTVVGRFFAGRQEHLPSGTSWGGFGHFGCCSLLVIQQVISVDPHDRQELDYRASADQPDITKVGCGFRDLLPIDTSKTLLEGQRRAERGEPSWAFDDSRHVAASVLASLINVPEASIMTMQQRNNTPGRVIYEWRPQGKRATYMLVVSRPYLLSFYSQDSRKRVAWAVIAAYEASCTKRNSITRIK
jgi:hypothetical protein